MPCLKCDPVIICKNCHVGKPRDQFHNNSGGNPRGKCKICYYTYKKKEIGFDRYPKKEILEYLKDNSAASASRKFKIPYSSLLKYIKAERTLAALAL